MNPGPSAYEAAALPPGPANPNIFPPSRKVNPSRIHKINASHVTSGGGFGKVVAAQVDNKKNNFVCSHKKIYFTQMYCLQDNPLLLLLQKKQGAARWPVAEPSVP